MNVSEVREKYLKFWQSPPRNHKVISPAQLVLENDPTTLFTSAGMQPLVPYLMGKEHPEGKRVVDSQPAIRTQDIDEVGDSSHTTYFEMLGNWSLGDYFKEDQLPWIWEFMTSELELPAEKLWVTVFEGSDEVPRDEEAASIWKKIGLPEERIVYYGYKENWWSRAGVPDNMPEGEIGGPSSEIFYEFTHVKHDKSFGKKCHPNCDCGRFLEIGNSVFIQYKKEKGGSLSSLQQKNVDFGGGLERLAAATIDSPDVFKIDIFEGMIKTMEEWSSSGKKYESDPKATSSMRIIADHIRAAVFLVIDGVIPSNKQQGYVLRRLLRRSAVKLRELGGLNSSSFMGQLAEEVLIAYDGQLSVDRNKQRDLVDKVVLEEAEKFDKTLDKGLREFEKLESIDGDRAFDLYQTFGFPLELTLELAEEAGQKVNVDEFKKAFKGHQEKSRSASAGKFKGGLADHSVETTSLHTATHLLHESLRKVLGEHVGQKGSNITPDRLRFDFTHSEKLSDDEVKKVEDMINEQIDKNLTVTKEVMSLEEAKKAGALAFFSDKYDEKVNVYTIGDFSKEVCGGPHVKSLSDIGGHVTIIRQESAGSGVRRLYAVIE